ncbi:hypothetical protein TNCV_1134151 [Trichonephila clavipes]|nr:hypothetical protein TNCV_1134151 [Trichonephila clavipes]
MVESKQVAGRTREQHDIEFEHPRASLIENFDSSRGRETVLASSFYSQYGLPTISGLPLHDGKGRYCPEKSMTDSPKVSRSW